MRSPSGRYMTGVVRRSPLLAPVLVSSSTGEPSNGPPTLPSLARNSSMIARLKSLVSDTSFSLRWSGGAPSSPLHISPPPEGDRRLGRQPDRERLQLVDEQRFGVERGAGDLDPREAPERLLEHHLQLQPCERRAEAEVTAARAERLVLGFAAEVEVVRVLVARLVAVGGDVPHHDLLALLDLLPVQLGVAGRRAAEVRERRKHAQRLLDGIGDQGGVIEQQLQLIAVFHERAHAAAVG